MGRETAALGESSALNGTDPSEPPIQSHPTALPSSSASVPSDRFGPSNCTGPIVSHGGKEWTLGGALLPSLVAEVTAQ